MLADQESGGSLDRFGTFAKLRMAQLCRVAEFSRQEAELLGEEV